MTTFIWNIKIITSNKLENQMEGSQVIPAPLIYFLPLGFGILEIWLIS